MVGLPSASICHKRRALFGGIMPLESDSLPHHWHPKSLASKIFSTMPTWSIYPHRTCSSSNPDGFEITTLWVMESDQCSHLQRMAAARHFPLTLIRSREKKRRSIQTTALMKRPKLMDFVKASKKSNGVLRWYLHGELLCDRVTIDGELPQMWFRKGKEPPQKLL